MSMFKLCDIEPGYLLRLHDSNEDKDFHVTVLPCCGYECGTFVGLLLAASIGMPESGDLAICGDDYYATLGCFDDELVDTIKRSLRIDAVYGYTVPARLLSNNPDHRELLWEREVVEEEPEENPVKRMTIEEISEALGYAVEIAPPRND